MNIYNYEYFLKLNIQNNRGNLVDLMPIKFYTVNLFIMFQVS